MVKKIFSFTLFLFISEVSFGQFQTVTGSPVVNDGLSSVSASWVDYDKDGNVDLMVLTGIDQSISIANSKPLLYRNNGDGSFTKIAAGNLVSETGSGRIATEADFDNDGLIDAFVVDATETKLYKNNGGGTFTKTTGMPTTPVQSSDDDNSSAGWGDYDGDGDLDLFITAFTSLPANANILYTNNGDGTFAKSSSSDLISRNAQSYYQSWIDYDHDGWLDLFVMGYFGQNFLYKNDGQGGFIPVSNALTVNVRGNVGSSWADYDNDGDLDVLFQSSVNQNCQFFENLGGGKFIEKFNGPSSVWTYSASWGDFDNDGFIDIILVGSGAEGKTYLFKNNGDKTFKDVTKSMGITNTNYSWGVATADYDKDGFLDIFIANADGNNFPDNDILYHNTPNTNGWIVLNLTGTKTNKFAIGANARIKASNRWQMRTIQSNTGANGQNSFQMHFGIGTASQIDSIIVEWPRQGYQLILNQEKNKFVDITEINFPKAPSNLSASCTVGKLVNLNWDDNSTDESGFVAEFSTSRNGPFWPIQATAANNTTTSLSSPKDGVYCYFRVAATTTNGWSLYSNLDSVLVHKSQGVTFPAITTKSLYSPPFELGATSTSGLPTNYILLGGLDKVALDGSQLSILALGSSTIGAFQKGNDVYYPSDTVVQVLNVTLTTGLDLSPTELQVYPNPVVDHLTINGLNPGDIRSAKLTNLIGQNVLTDDQILNDNTLSLKALSPGLYVLSLGYKRVRILK